VLAPQGIGVQVPSSAPIQRINKDAEKANLFQLAFLFVYVTVFVTITFQSAQIWKQWSEHRVASTGAAVSATSAR
jgi:hypothetical protein